MHWSYTVALVNPWGVRYRPAPAPDSPLLVEARREWTIDELIERQQGEPRTYVRMLQERDLAEHPEQLEAPAGWVAMLAGLAFNTLMTVLWERTPREKAMAATAVVTRVRSGARERARRRAAVRHGLTLADAPRLHIGCGPSFALPFVHFGLWLRYGHSFRRPTWPFWLAVGIVGELEERRSWRQARRTSTGRPVSSD